MNYYGYFHLWIDTFIPSNYTYAGFNLFFFLLNHPA